MRRTRLQFSEGEEVDIIPHHLLRKYIAYAKQYVHPKISPEAAAVIKDHYLDLRQHHRHVDSTPVTTRQLESLMRLTEVCATGILTLACKNFESLMLLLHCFSIVGAS